ncbi:DUF2059 domain-containing protein [Breoghania sp.]|uniref:DUF2059 domain-containing protein n=1 Tax=Breoghania sp. TaxID=2065378 RepID=UPI0026374B51|nr:DUF2059 domain-containing protein [Breoghania sp.]MDJ0932712.1 DUF2059 domain-containing protein [Breoghania sp.]
MTRSIYYCLTGGLAAVVLVASLGLAVPAMAQDQTSGDTTSDDQENFSKEHLAAARAAIEGGNAFRSFDDILPVIADKTRTLFIRTNPSATKVIDEVTNEVALKLANRRPELDHTIMKVWARRFTTEELKEIATFYRSPVGKKFADLGPELTALSIGAAKQWGDVISTEMVTRVREELNKRGYKF